ncbi:MAG: DUF2723 domain-containing protein [Chitinivibrionales bacterium]|nr:DUF2723 domain-containing protein [Chitinivibrionales bacterium]
MSHKQLNKIFALVVFSVAFFGYLRLAAPSISFWDCGEYAAAGYTLAIPHPPGNPLYVMISRIFAMALFFLKDVAFRMNMISVISSSLIAMLMYLTIVRVFIGWLGEPDTRQKKAVTYVGAFVGSLFAAFANTMFFQSVQAEAKASTSILPIMVSTWLIMVWYQSPEKKRDRLLILISYIAFLGMGIHQQSMLALLPIFLFVIWVDKEKRHDWKFWVVCCVNGLIIYNFSWFIVSGIVTMIIALAMSFQQRPDKHQWRFAFWLVFVGVIGFSVYTYVPIRSSLNPMIDENHPVTWQAFKGYLDRQQYGSESMITRMFWRRGTWAHQFGVEGHMGFGGFFITQFFRFSPTDTQKFFTQDLGKDLLKLLIYLIPTVFMLWGMWYLYRRYRNVALLFIFMELLTTVGLVFYMNFGDGQRPERYDYRHWVQSGKQGPMPLGQREVRVRDYFFLSGFLFHGMWMGLAAGCMLYGLYQRKDRLFQNSIAPACTVLLVLSPALPYLQNQEINNRKNDTVPFDFAYNLLMSCDKDGILFTNGDNDTFPLWALQEAFGIRKDVRLVNLSLVNTDWYIKQLKKLEPKVPISYSDKQIENLRPELNWVTDAAKSEFFLKDAGLKVNLPTYSQKYAILVQDKMVLNIVNSTKWTKPIYFSLTVSDDNLMGLSPYLKMEGLVFRLMPKEVPESERVDQEKTINFFEKVYRFEKINQKKVLLDETYRTTMSYYSIAYLHLALANREKLLRLQAEIVGLTRSLSDTTARAVLDTASQRQMLAQRRAELKSVTDYVLLQMDKCMKLVPWDDRPKMLRDEIMSITEQAIKG